MLFHKLLFIALYSKVFIAWEHTRLRYCMFASKYKTHRKHLMPCFLLSPTLPRAGAAARTLLIPELHQTTIYMPSKLDSLLQQLPRFIQAISHPRTSPPQPWDQDLQVTWRRNSSLSLVLVFRHQHTWKHRSCLRLLEAQKIRVPGGLSTMIFNMQTSKVWKMSTSRQAQLRLGWRSRRLSRRSPFLIGTIACPHVLVSV